MMISAIPKNIDELKNKANNKHNWHDRLESVEMLKNYDCIQSRDILTRLALHDPVFKVKEKAFRAAQALGVSKNGKPIYLSKRKKEIWSRELIRSLKKSEIYCLNCILLMTLKKSLKKLIQRIMIFMTVIWITSLINGFLMF